MIKKILFLISLLIMAAIIVANSQECTPHPWGISTNIYSHQYPGIGLEKALLAQDTKIGASIGLGVSPIRYKEEYLLIVDNKEIRGVRDVYAINALMWGEVLYKLLQKDYKYSLHVVGGTTLDYYKGVSLHTGLNIRIPDGFKAYYSQVTYRTDKVISFRIGIYLP